MGIANLFDDVIDRVLYVRRRGLICDFRCEALCEAPLTERFNAPKHFSLTFNIALQRSINRSIKATTCQR
jgi:hypothetical protein